MPDSEFAGHCRTIARRFLLTAVVVDDELSISTNEDAHTELVRPGLNVAQSSRPSVTRPSSRPLGVGAVTSSFARNGMICGMVSPPERSDCLDIVDSIARADIVVLDWRMDQAKGTDALPLLKTLLKEDHAHQHRIRLIAFYTGEPDHQDIRNKIIEGLNSIDIQPAIDHAGLIDFGSCRIVVYGKPSSPIVPPDIVVEEKDLAERLIADFADWIEGLLPSLVLTALAAVRDNVHRVLERFGRDLDPAFLTHRACLPQPSDAGRHIVEQIASELKGVMNDAVDSANPAGIEAIKLWLKNRFKENRITFGEKKMDYNMVIEMLQHGVEKKPGSLRTRGRNFDVLSSGFVNDNSQNARELDRRLASAMTFRQVFSDTARQLSLGTVVTVETNDEVLLCVTPQCDSVRLTESSSFLFIPLSDPKSNTSQVVVDLGSERHRRMTISTNPSSWRIVNFVPDHGQRCVLAKGNDGHQATAFKSEDGDDYRWVGELKPEFGQSVAQAIAGRMSRVALNKSEWLRRSERLGEVGLWNGGDQDEDRGLAAKSTPSLLLIKPPSAGATLLIGPLGTLLNQSKNLKEDTFYLLAPSPRPLFNAAGGPRISRATMRRRRFALDFAPRCLRAPLGTALIKASSGFARPNPCSACLGAKAGLRRTGWATVGRGARGSGVASDSTGVWSDETRATGPG